MHLYKRHKTWWIKYMVDGVLHRQSTHTHNRKEAETWMKSIDTARKMPTFEEAVDVLRILYKRQPTDGTIPLDAAWGRYLALAQSLGRLSAGERTLGDRERAYRAWLEWMAKNAATIRTIEAVSGAIAAEYAQTLTGKAKTRQNRIGHLCAIWNILEKASSRITNPWSKLAPAVTDSERLEAFTHEQEEKVLQAAKKVGKDWHPICVIARHTGLRYGDIVHLRWDDIDLEKNCIHKTPIKTRRYGIAVTLPLIAPVKAAIESLERQGEYLFPSHAALYRTRAGQDNLPFREVLDAAGITGNYTFHSWRHTAATNLAAAGVGIETRKRILGHTTDENAERYDHDAHLKELETAMEKAAKQ